MVTCSTSSVKHKFHCFVLPLLLSSCILHTSVQAVTGGESGYEQASGHRTSQQSRRRFWCLSDYSGGRGRGRVAGAKGFRKGRGHKSALVISGFVYTLDASATNPKNMLMIIGKWDEYRERMTETDDIEREWMNTPQTQKAIPIENPQLGVTYGNFAQGTARRVFVPIRFISKSPITAPPSLRLWSG